MLKDIFPIVLEVQYPKKHENEETSFIDGPKSADIVHKK